MLDTQAIRRDFPILNRRINGYQLVYFDNAATTQKPIQVIEAIRDFYENHNANVHRAVHTLSQESSELYESAHEEIANFIGADSMQETIFVRGTTEAINLVAYSWGCHNLKKGDEILVTLMEHHSNIVPWEILATARGYRVRYSQINADGTLNYEALEKSFTKRTRFVCVSHVSNVTGIINDVERVAKLAHENGALLLVDGAQSVPHIPIKVKELDADFLAFSGHKMLGPTGIGVLYGKKHLLDKMAPFHGGGEMIKEVSYKPAAKRCSITWNDLPWKFEAGTPNISGGIGLMEAVRYLKKIGMDSLQTNERKLTEHAMRRMRENAKLTIYGPAEPSVKCGIIPFGIENLNSHDIALFLDSYGIMIRSGFHCAQPLHRVLRIESSARTSFYVYNTVEEIDRFVDILEELGETQ